jgi:hypothetical protein
MYGKSEIRIRRLTKKELTQKRIASGGSYQDKTSVVYENVKKNSNTFRLNLIATICIDERRPVPHFKLDEEYANGSVFATMLLIEPFHPTLHTI